MRKKTDAGFTLIELVVTIVCCSIVTLAVMTVLLTGTRIGRAAEESSGEQQTVRIVLSALENMISDGAVTGIRLIGDDWALLGEGEDEKPIELLSYSGGQGALLTSGGTPLLDGMTSATAELSDDGDLLTVTVNMDDNEYMTTVYCRVAAEETGEKLDSTSAIKSKVEAALSSSSEATYPARKAFLSVAASQYGSTGDFSYKVEDETISGSFSGWYNLNWDKDTPWCMTFLSWVANPTKSTSGTSYLAYDDAPCFAHVDKCMAAFQSNTCGSWKVSAPIPGDFIFFDWERDGDPDHIGAVLATDTDGGIYTIEGNSGGKVAVRYYRAGDARILGYGVLNWKSNSNT